jgi:dihydropteroate synthase
MINDVSGGKLDTAMFDTVAALGVPYIGMHMRGTPATMAGLNQYDDLITDIYRELVDMAVQLNRLGVKDVILDPGFGFAKNIDQNFKLLKELEQFCLAGYPLLVGVSRKSMIYKTLDTSPEAALNGSSILHAWALERGARILRVHDVKPAMEAIQLWRRFETV